MIDLPQPVMEHIRELCIDKRHPTFLFIDGNGCLQRFGGFFEYFGFAPPRAGVSAVEQIEFLEGLLPVGDAPLWLPFLQTPSRRYIDLHLFPGAGGTWVLMIDVTAEADRLYQVQQSSHDLALMREKQDEMLRQIRQNHDNLLSVFNHLNLITALVDETGKTTFLSQAGERFFDLKAGVWRQSPWDKVLGFGADAQAAIRRLLSLPARERRRERLTTERTSGRPCAVEIDVQDDPRNPACRMIYIYDISELHELRGLLQEKAQYEGMIGRGKPMQQIFQLIRDIARVDATVLIAGETGTGKELVAAAIHHASPRREGPFITVNVAGLSDSLINSQLFGHKKGAFTDAIRDQEGVFEAANGGTIFLDEIGDIPMNTQTRILRVLEQREFVRIGETQPRHVDIRIIAATNKSLDEEVREGRFRMDLLYRIRVARVDLPPLRERREDIPLLAEAFLVKSRASSGKPVDGIANETMRLLLDHAWPGNVRELRNAIEFAVIRCPGRMLEPDDLPPEIRNASETGADRHRPGPSQERDLILNALETAGGRRGEAARLLGISRATLYRRMRDCRLPPPSGRRPSQAQ